MGQSTTLTGRQIAKHMGATVNSLVAGEYNHLGPTVLYQDTDSEIGSTIHHTNYGEKTIKDLFNDSTEFWDNGDKEYAYDPELMVMSYDHDLNEPFLSHINYIYRHKVSKDLYEIDDELGNVITVTEDHSVMVERDGVLIEVKPQDITQDDILISILIESSDDYLKSSCKNLLLNDDDESQVDTIKTIRTILNKPTKSISLYKGKVKSVKKIRKANDEYVYDIGMKNESKPWYFGNNILIHNSVYFSAYPILKNDIDNGTIPWSKEDITTYYDDIGDKVNETFQQFMLEAFNCPYSRGDVIRSGREIVAEKGLFITKKRYAVLVYDKEGKRKDINGKIGEIKAMGLDLKRSDTPDYMQDFLSQILEMVLTGVDENIVLTKIKDFRAIFKTREGWDKGSPKRANNITKYQGIEEETGKANMPGHVRASINWNTLKKIFDDKYSMSIVDGAKVIVCKLKPNPTGFTSVAYPVDEMRLPQWFKDLPFDHQAMEEAIVDKKVENLIGVLNWNLHSTNEKTTFNSLFKFK